MSLLRRLLDRLGGSPRPAPAGPSRASVPPSPPPVSPDELLRRLDGCRHVAFVPEVTEGAGAPGGSRFGGAPWLAAGEAWPACGNCGRPMSLFVQLAGGELPPAAQERVRPGELLQLFYCTRDEPLCEVDCEAYSPHARSTLLRLVPAAGDGWEPPVPEGCFPPRAVAGWSARDDYPGPDELHAPGVGLREEQLDDLWDEYPLEGDKLLGWPRWVQSVEYPSCRVCGREMTHLFQIDSERNVPHMFGDVGIAHVTQCPEHRRELAFGWACH